MEAIKTGGVGGLGSHKDRQTDRGVGGLGRHKDRQKQNTDLHNHTPKEIPTCLSVPPWKPEALPNINMEIPGIEDKRLQTSIQEVQYYSAMDPSPLWSERQ